jgi:[acyl-carrier-protein] S-malonyltransferase
MGRIGLVFPGQGSQFVGMGKDLCDLHKPFRKIFDRAREILGRDILSLCLEGPKEVLDQSVNTQLAVLTFEIAAFETVRELDVLHPAVIAGHSLGEYSAIYASGALELDDVLRLVHARAKHHEEAVPPGLSAMAAIVGLTLDRMKDLVQECSRENEPVDLANLNAPIQAVVSGHAGAVERLMERAKEIGAKLVVRLPISAPCHSRLLTGASDLFTKDLAKVHFKPFEIPIIPNCDPSLYYTTENAAELLRRQIISPVRWQETVEKMAEMGIDTIIEIGPKRVLSGLIKNIRKDIRPVYVGDAETLLGFAELVQARP